MIRTQIAAVDRSNEKAQAWLDDLTRELGEDSAHAYRVLCAFLHALRDELSVAEGAQLAAQLPIFVRGIFYEGWEPARASARTRDLDTFLLRLAAEAGLAGKTEASFAALAASRVLSNHVSDGEARSVEHELPHQIRALFELRARDGDVT